MSTQKKGQPKVECRSRTGGSFSRGGHRWSSDFSDVPEALLKDDAVMQLLSKDPHLEIKVDGKYVTGPRAPKPGDAVTAPSPKDADISDMRETIDYLDKRIAQLEDDASKARAEATAAKAEAEAAKKAAAEATAQLDALKKAAPTPPATPAATDAPTTKDDAKKPKG